MGRLAIDKDFLGDYSKRDKTSHAAVRATIDRFAACADAGLQLEKIKHCKDDQVRIDLLRRASCLLQRPEMLDQSRVPAAIGRR